MRARLHLRNDRLFEMHVNVLLSSVWHVYGFVKLNKLSSEWIVKVLGGALKEAKEDTNRFNVVSVNMLIVMSNCKAVIVWAKITTHATNVGNNYLWATAAVHWKPSKSESFLLRVVQSLFSTAIWIFMTCGEGYSICVDRSSRASSQAVRKRAN